MKLFSVYCMPTQLSRHQNMPRNNIIPLESTKCGGGTIVSSGSKRWCKGKEGQRGGNRCGRREGETDVGEERASPSALQHSVCLLLPGLPFPLFYPGEFERTIGCCNLLAILQLTLLGSVWLGRIKGPSEL